MHPTRERMAYVRSIQNHLLDSIYADEEKTLTKAMWLIAEENQVLLYANSPTFVYDGRWWPLPKVPDPVNCNKLLHSSLYARVQELLDNVSFKDIEMKAGISSLIGNFLSAAGNVSDLYQLFPTAVQVNLPYIDMDIFDIAEPLSEEKIQKLLIQNEINLKYFKRLIMTQVLLART